jgi:hypothetical protein
MEVISSKKWLELILSLKYISNASIFGIVISYYTQAFPIFLILIPVVITNFIVILVIQWYNSKELVKVTLELNDNNNDNSDELEKYQTKFIILNTLWNLLPLLWLYYILQKDNIIVLFKPNFMGSFLSGAIFSIIYFYFASNGSYYGNIDYSRYMIIYIVILLSVSISLYF